MAGAASTGSEPTTPDDEREANIQIAIFCALIHRKFLCYAYGSRSFCFCARNLSRRSSRMNKLFQARLDVIKLFRLFAERGAGKGP
jgi:hypothetical protein